MRSLYLTPAKLTVNCARATLSEPRIFIQGEGVARFQSARQSIILFQLFRDLALLAPAMGLSNAFINSRLRFRLSSFFFCLRLNLALSPFLFDTYSPLRSPHFDSVSERSDGVASPIKMIRFSML